MNAAWHNVSRREPCPVCRKPDWCTVSNDGAVCVCRRVPSPRPARSGDGWIHFLQATGKRPTTNYQKLTNQLTNQLTNYTPIDAARVFNALRSDEAFRAALAARLGVAAAALTALDVRRDPFTGAAAFPMRDAAGCITGIRYRDAETGRKWSLRGGRDGVFAAAAGGDGQGAGGDGQGAGGDARFPHDELIVCEGASDTAAALSLGLAAVGRSSCTSGTETLRALCRRHHVRYVTIVADGDAPGLAGARRLAESLALTSRIVPPPAPHKDLRAWYTSDRPTLQDVRRHIHRFAWRRV